MKVGDKVTLSDGTTAEVVNVNARRKMVTLACSRPTEAGADERYVQVLPQDKVGGGRTDEKKTDEKK